MLEISNLKIIIEMSNKCLIYLVTIQIQLCVTFALKYPFERKLAPQNFIGRMTDNRMRIILEWNNSSKWSVFHAKGSLPFIRDKCPHSNCFITQDRNFLPDITQYDAVVFSFPGLNKFMDFPTRRSAHQKYVFTAMESPWNFPLFSNFNNFFNWTWTYRLDSDVVWGYIAIRDRLNKEIGPKTEMHWISDMQPIDETIKLKLASKQKAVAWFVSNCRTVGKREKIVRAISKHLQDYGLTVDVYGKCGNLSCPRSNMAECRQNLEQNYYFYLAFENSLSEDYVTEKLLHAVMHDTVPIVYGGANYTRFMPDGMYLNAATLEPQNLSRAIYEAIKDPNKYYEYFRYKNHYRYSEKKNYCGICALLNDRKRVRQNTVYSNMPMWWNNKKPRKLRKKYGVQYMPFGASLRKQNRLGLSADF